MNARVQPPDQAARLRALDITQSFIVQAPAGSGKTELLIQRYLALLAVVPNPEEIVAITFTRKAAAEMRQRVLNALSQRQDAQARALTDNPQRLRILTIDALCANITRQMPVLSCLGGAAQTLEDAWPLYLEAVRDTVALLEVSGPAQAHLQTLLVHLDNDTARIETLLAEMLSRRDHWLRLAADAARDTLEAALQRARQLALDRLHRVVPAQSELRALANYAFSHLRGDAFADTLDDWRLIADFFLTKTKTWRAAATVKQGFPAGTNAQERASAQQWKARYIAWSSEAQQTPGVYEALCALYALPAASYRPGQWQVLEAILYLSRMAVAQLQLVFRARGALDFTEVSLRALQALGSEDAPTDLALALDHRISHLLVDEFQDTSISQYTLIERLTAGWQSGPQGDGRTLFVVGDPMQSIYRFREAEVGKFLQTRAQGIGTVQLAFLQLHANFRSQAGIVDWVNQVFAQTMPAQADAARGAVPYAPSQAVHPALAGEAVCVHAFFNQDVHGEAARVVSLVQHAQREDPQGTVAILVRHRGALREIVPALQAAHLRFRAIDIEPLESRQVVQDLLSLTCALTHRADRIAWLAVLRAPWCGLRLSTLTLLAARDSTGAQHTFWQRMQDEALLAQLPDDERARVLRMVTVLTAPLQACGRIPLRQCVESAWLALGGPACVSRQTDLVDADVFFGHLERHAQAGMLVDRQALIAGLARLFAQPDVQADDRLQVMTIHKAKGLQFDHVIVPGLGRGTRNDSAVLLRWMERPRAVGQGAELLLAPIEETGAGHDPTYRWLQTLEAEREAFEAVRLLYVAATRAKQRLHLLGDVSVRGELGQSQHIAAPARHTLLHYLWPSVSQQVERALTQWNDALQQGLSPTAPTIASPAASKAVNALTATPGLVRLSFDWSLPEPPSGFAWQGRVTQDALEEDVIEFSWAGETARQVGTVVHRWLQRIAEDSLQGWSVDRIASLSTSIRAALVVQGVSAPMLDAACERVTQALIFAVQDPRGRWLLGPHQEASNELRLRYVDAARVRTLVLDRCFVDADGTRWVVDYKSSRHEGEDQEAFLDREQQRYRAQLERYATALGGARKGLYFPLLSAWRDW